MNVGSAEFWCPQFVFIFFLRPTNVGSAEFWSALHWPQPLCVLILCLLFSRGRPMLDLLNFGHLNWPQPLRVLIYCLFFQWPTNVGFSEFWSPSHWPWPLRDLILCLFFSRGRPTLDLLNFGHLYTDLSLYGNLRVSIGQSIFGKCINKVKY